MTPISTPDIQSAAIQRAQKMDEMNIDEYKFGVVDDDDIGNKSSDLGGDDDDNDNDDDSKPINKRVKSGIDDIDDMVFAFNGNDKKYKYDQYKQNEEKVNENQANIDKTNDNMNNNDEVKQN